MLRPPPAHAHLLAHLVTKALLPAGRVLPVLLAQLVPSVGAVGEAVVVVALLLGPVLAVALAPLGFVFPPHELVEVVVVPLALALLVFGPVLLVSLPAAVLLLQQVSLLFVALQLDPGVHRGVVKHT